MPFATPWMDLGSIMLSEVSQRRNVYDYPYTWNLKRNKLTYKTETHRLRK